MASGNLGELWFNLGVKDSTSKTFNGMLRTLKETDGSVSALRTKLEELKKTSSGKDGFDKGLRSAIKNAYDYLGMLQTIEAERRKIAELKILNKDAKDLSGLERADGLLQKIKSDLMDLQKVRFGGVDLADLMPYQNALRNTLKDVRSLSSAFQRDNSLTDAASNAARLKIELEKSRNKLSEIYSMQSDGMKRGIDTKTLLSAGNTLRGVKTRIENMLADDKSLSNGSKFKSLISDIAYANEKAKGNLAEYNRLKKSSVADERRRLSEMKTSESRMTSLEKTINDLYKAAGRSMTLKVDTSKAESEIARLESTLSTLSSIKKRLEGGDLSALGALGNIGTGRDLITSKKVLQEQKELNRERERLDRQNEAKSKSDERRRLSEIETIQKRYEKLGDALDRLRSSFREGVSLKVDTRMTEAKIQEIESQMTVLSSIKSRLERGDLTYLGQSGRTGDDRQVTLANRAASAQEKANKETQRGIDLERRRQKEISNSAARVQSELVRGLERANHHAGTLNSTIQDLKSLFLQGGLVFGAQQFAMSIITTGGEMEKQHIALQSILGDMQNANTLFGQIKELALNSPFTFSELNRDVKQLAAYGVEYDQLYDTTKRLADMSSGLGVSFDRIALAFGQVQARGWLDGKELRQIAYAGIPLLDKLSDYYSKQEGRKVSTSEIKTRISKRDVSFDDVKNIFWQMTDAGGQFYNMQQALSETLLGRYNKLKDAWEIMLAEFAGGESLVGSFFKTAINGATELVQSLHTLALPAGTLFAGYTIKKMLSGGTASNFLTNKSSLAADIQSRILQGKEVSRTERDILNTRKKITDNDLRLLTSSRALTNTELNRLRISGQITAEQYKTYRAIILQQTGSAKIGMQYKRMLVTLRSMTRMTPSFTSAWSAFATSGMSALRLVGTGIKTLGATLWSAIGGLPGLIVSAATAGITYAISEYMELSQKIAQTKDELNDKNSQIQRFLKDNNVSVTISKGDDKDIDNMIEAYKEKLKELAPYDYRNIYMTAEEKESHKERLKYLEEEISMLQEANSLASGKMQSRSYYSDITDDISDTLEKLTQRQELALRASMPGASEGDKNLYEDEKAYGNYIEKLKEDIERKFGDISGSEKIRHAAMQAMSAVFSSLGVPEDKADLIRTSLLQAFGIGEKSTWLQTQVGNEMRTLIDATFPIIGDKIKSSIPLNEAEKAKVRELMDDAKAGLVSKYPELESTLQKMLAASRFEAVIKLTVDTGTAYNDVQSELVRRVPQGPLSNEALDKYRKRANEYGKDNDWYTARNAAKDIIDKAYNNWESAKKSGAPNAEELHKAYLDEKSIAKTLLHYDYDGEGKKSNKTPKANAAKKDTALEDLKKRISLYKKMYAEIRKFSGLYGNGALKKLSESDEFKYIFSNKSLFPISDYKDYGSSINEILGTLPANTQERKDFVNDENAGIHSEKRRLLEENRREELDTLGKQLDIIREQYDTYKKLYELTGDSEGAGMVAFGSYVQTDTYKKALEGRLSSVLGPANTDSGLSHKIDDIKSMDTNEVKKLYGEESPVYYIRQRLEEENNRVKKESIDTLADIISKNATISQQIDDENKAYERQSQLVSGIKDAGMRQRAQDGLEKNHNDKMSQLQFELFKEENDWVSIFDDLDRVSTGTIDTMVTKIDDFSKEGSHSVEVVKQLRDALGKLRQESISRNPIPSLFGGVRRGNAIGNFINTKVGKGADGVTKVVVDKDNAKKMGIAAGTYSVNQLRSEQKSSYQDSQESIISLSEKMSALSNVMSPVVDLFGALGEQDSVLGKITGGASNALGAASQVAGGLKSLGLDSLGPYGAIAGAGISMAGTLISVLGAADYSSYYKAKQEYSSLISVWDSLISKKTEYMNIHWGTEADSAAKEAQEMLRTEIEQTKIVAQKALDAGSGLGSRSIRYRMWQGSYKYNGQNWKDVAPEISEKYGVDFTSMDSLLSMSTDVLEKIKTDYTGLWANMDDDFRDYLEKLIEYGDQMDDMIESANEKLTGNKFTDLVSSWGDAMTQMSNTSDSLVDHFEDNLKKTIVNSMIEELYKDKIDSILDKAKTYGDRDQTENVTDSNGNIISAFTGSEYAEVMGDVEDVAKQIEASRDYLKRTYGWSDNSSSSSVNSVKGITEEEASNVLSYLNSMRSDLSVVRDTQAKYLPEMSGIAKSQLAQMEMITQNTLRNAESAERIESTVTTLNDTFNKVTNGTKYLYVR